MKTPPRSLTAVEPKPMAPSYPPPAPAAAHQQQQQQYTALYPYSPAPDAAAVASPLRDVRACCHFGLSEYVGLQGSRHDDAGEMDRRVKAQAQVVGDLRVLGDEVQRLVRRAEKQRWRRCLLGGVAVALMPIMRRIFRRTTTTDSRTWSNDTEYALDRSQSLLARMAHRGMRLGTSSLAKVSFIVFAVVYMFHNEVKLRVARTLHRRVRRLRQRVERGEAVEREDVGVLEGWRWRVLI